MTLWKKLLLLQWALVSSSLSWAGTEVLSVSLDQVRPTQFCVGELDVAAKSDALRELQRESPELLQKKLEKPLQAVRGPQGEIFLVDGHHTAHATMNRGYSSIRILLIEDWSHLSEVDFWNRMAAKHYTYLRDEKGVQRSPSELPRRLKDMLNDPYRTLAGWLRKAGGFEWSPVPFAEFYWAERLRRFVPRELIRAETKEEALRLALPVASHPEMADLPGYKRSPAHCVTSSLRNL